MATHSLYCIPDPYPLSNDTDAALIAEIRTSGWYQRQTVQVLRARSPLPKIRACQPQRQCAADHSSADNGNFLG